MKVFIELIESCLPQPALLGQPVLGQLESLWVDLENSHSAFLLRLHETALFKNCKVLYE